MSNENTQSFKLSDDVIGQIVQLIQMGILTGTDISDQIRTLRVVHGDGDVLEPCPDYMDIFNENMNRMTSLADEKADA
tara:strand:+ start:1680 stop:1913 length:234 start_codon:yes stop_codon:yes gene_type:complete